MRRTLLCLCLLLLLAKNATAQDKPSETKFYQPNSPGKYLLGSMGVLFGTSALLFGTFTLLPESITGWTDDDIANAGKNYLRKVSMGPVVDNDLFYINFLGHPYSGAIYYMQPRSAGYSWAESILFAFGLSALWEFGIEALAEPPSWQDLIITPALGSLLGEAFYRFSRYIQDNDSRLFGSRFVGKTLLFFMDPIGFVMRDGGVARAIGVQDKNVATLLLPQKGGLVASLKINW